MYFQLQVFHLRHLHVQLPAKFGENWIINNEKAVSYLKLKTALADLFGFSCNLWFCSFSHMYYVMSLSVKFHKVPSTLATVIAVYANLIWPPSPSWVVFSTSGYLTAVKGMCFTLLPENLVGIGLPAWDLCISQDC
jgi:hypothetical protein